MEISTDKLAKELILAQETETLYSNYKYNNIVILVTGYFEWMYLNDSGKKYQLKMMYRMRCKEEYNVCIAGFFDLYIYVKHLSKKAGAPEFKSWSAFLKGRRS